jgi:CBS domain containing-hemolysin-like protein
MESGLRTAEASSAEIISAASWGSIAAGAVTASAVSLALVALGVGLGLSAVSPWTDTGVSASTFKITAGVYLVLVAVIPRRLAVTYPRVCALNGSASTPMKHFSATPRMAS